MKKQLSIILLALLVFTFSCTKDDNLVTKNSNANSLKATGTLPFSVTIRQIQFDYDPTSNSSDAISIRKNWTTPYTNSTYDPSSNLNQPFAYVKGQSNIKIKVWITATNTGISLHDSVRIQGVLQTGGEIGNFNGTIYFASCDQNVSYGVGYLTSDGSVASTVGINNNLKWQWNVTGWYDAGWYKTGWNTCNSTIATSGPHTLYRLYSVPTTPWYFSGNPVYGDPLMTYSGNASNGYLGKEPNIDYVLANACAWANGLSDPNAIITAITKNTYSYIPSLGSSYNSVNNLYETWDSHVTPYALIFNILNFGKFPGGGGVYADCRCASDYVHILTRALGINTSVVEIHNGNGTSNFSTTPCQPFGLTGYYSYTFNMHQVVTYNNLIWDPTSKYANNNNSLITGISKSTYLSEAIATTNSLMKWDDLKNVGVINWEIKFGPAK